MVCYTCGVTILETRYRNVYVLLTVHLGIILDNDQLEAQLLYFTIRLL